MKRRIFAACIGITFVATLAGVLPAAAQDSKSADVSGKFTIAVPDNSKLRIVNSRAEVCAEIPLGVAAVSYRAVITASAACQLSPGDALGFWLIYPNGAIDILSPSAGQLAQWIPGGKLSLDLGRVPCPDPCRPPDIAGAPDPVIALPRVGTGSHAESRLPLMALGLLVFPAALLVLRRRRDPA